jgi:hypothetical protein
MLLPNSSLTAPAMLGVASQNDDLTGASSGTGASTHWSHGISLALVNLTKRIHMWACERQGRAFLKVCRATPPASWRLAQDESALVPNDRRYFDSVL